MNQADITHADDLTDKLLTVYESIQLFMPGANLPSGLKE